MTCEFDRTQLNREPLSVHFAKRAKLIIIRKHVPQCRQKWTRCSRQAVRPAALFVCLVLLRSLFRRVLGLRICFRWSCGHETALAGDAIIGMVSLAMRLWVYYIRGYGSAFMGPVAMGLLSWVLWPWVCFHGSCGHGSAFMGPVAMDLLSWVLWPWVCFHGSCGHGSAFMGPVAMGLHLTVHDPVVLGLFRCSCGHKSILVGHVAMDLFSWVLP